MVCQLFSPTQLGSQALSKFSHQSQKNKMEEGERNENTTSTSCIFCTCGVFNCMCALIGLYGMTIYISPPENLWR